MEGTLMDHYDDSCCDGYDAIHNFLKEYGEVREGDVKQLKKDVHGFMRGWADRNGTSDRLQAIERGHEGRIEDIPFRAYLGMVDFREGKSMPILELSRVCGFAEYAEMRAESAGSFERFREFLRVRVGGALEAVTPTAL